jgi:hypothetical protein
MTLQAGAPGAFYIPFQIAADPTNHAARWLCQPSIRAYSRNQRNFWRETAPRFASAAGILGTVNRRSPEFGRNAVAA